jgi:ferritin-like protein
MIREEADSSGIAVASPDGATPHRAAPGPRVSSPSARAGAPAAGRDGSDAAVPGTDPASGPTPDRAADLAADPMADPMADPTYRGAVIELLGALAYGEITAFERLAEDARLAPTIEDKAALAEMAIAEFGHFRLLRERLAALGAEPERAMVPFVEALDAFHESTPPSDWLEGLVKAYVGDGFAADFYREVASALDPATRDLVLAVLGDTGHAAFAVERVRAAIAHEPAVAGRLALWARRLVGEALRQAQRIALDRAELAQLIVGGASEAEAVARLFTTLTQRHAQRMSALGLSS